MKNKDKKIRCLNKHLFMHPNDKDAKRKIRGIINSLKSKYLDDTDNIPMPW